MNLRETRASKAAKVAEARALVAAAEKEGRSLTADEAKSFDKLKSEITDLEAAETRAQFLAEQERQMSGEPVHGDTREGLEARVSLVDVLAAKIEGRALSGAAAEYHAEAERRTGRKAQGVFVPASLLEKRAPNMTTTAGELVGTDHRGQDFIGPLRDSLIVRRLGLRVLSGLTGNVSIPKYGTGLSASWVAENQAIPESQMTFDAVTLTPKHVGALTSWSRQLALQSNPSIEQLLRDDLAYAIGAEVDRAIIAGTGGVEPLGLLNTEGVQEAALPQTWAEVLAIEQQLAGLNVTPNGWYTSPSVLSGLRGTLREDGIAGYIAEGGRIGDVPAYTSNAAPADTAILGDWSHIILGTWSEIDLLVNPFEGDAYRRGNVLIRAMMTCDVAIRHPEGFVVATDAGTP